MDSAIAFSINFKFIFILLALGIFTGQISLHFWPSSPLALFYSRTQGWNLQNWRITILTSVLGFFLLSFCCRWSQFNAMVYSAWDFWLFQDMWKWLIEGKIFITRFSANAVGPMQHGGIHSFLTWVLSAPLALVLGPTAMAIVFNPLITSLSAAALAKLAWERTGSAAAAVGLSWAFLGNEYINRINNYEVHPEVLYPLLTFLAALPSLVQGSSFRKRALLFFCWICLAGVKEDAFLIFAPLWIWLTLTRQWSFKQAGLIGAAAVTTQIGMLLLMGFYNHGGGATELVIQNRTYTAASPGTGSHVLEGKALSGIGDIINLVQPGPAHSIGLQDSLLLLIKNFFPRSYLPFLVVCPWILTSMPALFLLSPVLVAYAKIGSVIAELITYYSAAVMGLYFLGLILVLTQRKKTDSRGSFKFLLTWTVIVSLLLGGSAPTYTALSAAGQKVKEDALLAVQQAHGVGSVSANLLGVVPEEVLIAAQAIPAQLDPKIDWVLFPKYIRSQVDSEVDHQRWETWIHTQPNWTIADFGSVRLYQKKPDH